MGCDSAKNKGKHNLNSRSFFTKEAMENEVNFARGLLCFINYGTDDAFRKILKYFKLSNSRMVSKNLKYEFVSAIISHSKESNNKIAVSGYSFEGFLNSFIKGVSLLKIWQKSEKEIGIFVSKVFSYLFSKENTNENFILFNRQTIQVKTLIRDAGPLELKFKNMSFKLTVSDGELYGIKFDDSKKIVLTTTLKKQNSLLKINTIEKLKSIKNAQEYIEIHKKINEKINNPRTGVPCPLCNPKAINKGKPKSCAECDEALFMLSKISFIKEAALKDAELFVTDVTQKQTFEGIKIKQLVRNFRNSAEYQTIRKKIYENIKNGIDRNNFTKLNKKHIMPLITYYKSFLKEYKNFRNSDIDISKLENLVRRWNLSQKS